jgi:hypothetical protein
MASISAGATVRDAPSATALRPDRVESEDGARPAAVLAEIGRSSEI